MRTLVVALVLLLLTAGVARAEDTLPLAIHRVAGDAAGPALAPRVAVGPADKIYVAWMSNGDVRVTSALSDAEGWMKPATASDGRGTAWAAHGEGPSLAVDRLGYVYLAWTDTRRGQRDSDVLFAQSGADVAESLTTPKAVNAGGSEAGRTFQSLAVDEKGRIYVAWQEEGGGPPRIMLATSTDGGDFEANEASRGFPGVPCECCRLSLVSDGAGHVWLAFREDVNDVRDIYAAATGDGGRSFNYPVLVSPDRWRMTHCPMAGPSIAVDRRGRPLVAWWKGGDDSGGRIGLARATDDGRGFERPLLLVKASTATSRPALAVRDQAIVLAWEDRVDRKPVVRGLYSDDGARTWRKLRLGLSDHAPGRSPAVALDSRGRPVVSWSGLEADPAVFVAR